VPTLVVQAPANATATLRPATAAPTSTPLLVDNATPSALPTVEPALADEVGRAYVTYWQIRAEALLDLDTSRLSEVMAGDHLISVERLIDQLRAEGHAIQTDVEHKYAIVRASHNDAEINDTYIDTSAYVDITSHQVVSAPTNDILHEQYTMNRIDGNWRVVSLVRAP
jgi:hypothetical protein